MTNQQILETLASLESRLVRLESRLDSVIATASSGAKSSSAARGSAASGRVADTSELDGPRGNPEVRTSPKRWTGEDCKGRRFSECPPEFLDELASLCDWMADRDDDAGARGELDARGYRKDGKWKRIDAALARGWAARLRGGWTDGAGGVSSSSELFG